jgi:hypothetical protein
VRTVGNGLARRQRAVDDLAEVFCRSSGLGVETGSLSHRSSGQRAKERMSTSRSIANSASCLRRSLISPRTFSVNRPSPT